MGMTPAEALVAATEHAALAVDRSDRGRLDVGAPADFVVLDGPRYAHAAYQFGTNVAARVFKDGRPAA
jgi:imidazolonepropionase